VSLPYIVATFKDTITPVGKVIRYTLQTYTGTRTWKLREYWVKPMRPTGNMK